MTRKMDMEYSDGPLAVGSRDTLRMITGMALE